MRNWQHIQDIKEVGAICVDFRPKVWHNVAVRKPLLIAMAILVVVGVASWGFMSQREPAYQGKPFSFWLDRYCWNFMASSAEGIKERNQAEVAVRQIGTNGLPVLLGMIKAANSHPWQDKANELLCMQSLISFRFSRRYDYRAAVQGFILLGANAAPAVPALIELLTNSDPDVREAATIALGAIKPEPEQAVLPLVQRINDTDGWVRFEAIRAIGQIHRKPELAVPALIGNLQSSNPQPAAMAALAEFEEGAKSATPILLAFLDNPIENFRTWATNALKRIDPTAAAKAGMR